VLIISALVVVSFAGVGSMKEASRFGFSLPIPFNTSMMLARFLQAHVQ